MAVSRHSIDIVDQYEALYNRVSSHTRAETINQSFSDKELRILMGQNELLIKGFDPATGRWTEKTKLQKAETLLTIIDEMVEPAELRVVALPKPQRSSAAGAGSRQSAAARRGATAGTADDAAREFISSLLKPQRSELAEALTAGVDLAALLNEFQQAAGTPPSLAGRRVECVFWIDRRLTWCGGRVLRENPVGDHWTDVLFDDNEQLCVHLAPSTDGTLWRWELPGTAPVSGQEPAPKRRRQSVPSGPKPKSVAVLAEEDKPAAAAAAERQGPSEFVGVSLTPTRKWVAKLSHDRKPHYLGTFDDEYEAAQAVDTAARRLRGDDAHGGQCIGGGKTWWLNFPTEGEVKRAQERFALLAEEEEKAAAASGAKPKFASKFVGVQAASTPGKWRAGISHNGDKQTLGSFADEEEAARAVDTAARRLRGDGAHGGRPRSGQARWRLNFPTPSEVKKANERGAFLTEKDEAPAAAAAEQRLKFKHLGVPTKKAAGKTTAAKKTTKKTAKGKGPGTGSGRGGARPCSFCGELGHYAKTCTRKGSHSEEYHFH
jgi:hypothetical protein